MIVDAARIEPVRTVELDGGRPTTEVGTIEEPSRSADEADVLDIESVCSGTEGDVFDATAVDTLLEVISDPELASCDPADGKALDSVASGASTLLALVELNPVVFDISALTGPKLGCPDSLGNEPPICELEIKAEDLDELAIVPPDVSDPVLFDSWPKASEPVLLGFADSDTEAVVPSGSVNVGLGTSDCPIIV